MYPTHVTPHYSEFYVALVCNELKFVCVFNSCLTTAKSIGRARTALLK